MRQKRKNKEFYEYAKTVLELSIHAKAKINTKEQRHERMKRIICPQAPACTSNRDKKTLFCFKACHTSMVLVQLDSE